MQPGIAGGRSFDRHGTAGRNERETGGHEQKFGENAAKFNVECRVPIEVYVFIGGFILSFVCSFRINVRAYASDMARTSYRQ
jgi:hypothetical protein